MYEKATKMGISKFALTFYWQVYKILEDYLKDTHCPCHMILQKAVFQLI